MIKPIYLIAALLLTAGSAYAQQSVVGAPKAVPADDKQLTYRDPAEPISIGEMSDKQAAAETEKFLNVSIAEEKEVILIVSPADRKADIMRAIVQKAGPGSEAGAIVFSLPVSEVAGFGLFEE